MVWRLLKGMAGVFPILAVQGSTAQQGAHPGSTQSAWALRMPLPVQLPCVGAVAAATLTARGIDSIEYNCEFVTVTKASRAPAWLVNAVCQEPGYLFPDVLTITQMNETQIDIVSVTPTDPETGGGNGGSYYLCDGVAPP